MKRLAIKGHATRGSEVIGLLKMLGGNNYNQCSGGFINSIYFINDNGYIEASGQLQHLEYHQMSLEEFLVEYPYKVGDKVRLKCSKDEDQQRECVVNNMYLINSRVVYDVLKNGCVIHCLDVSQLHAYDTPYDCECVVTCDAADSKVQVDVQGLFEDCVCDAFEKNNIHEQYNFGDIVTITVGREKWISVLESIEHGLVMVCMSLRESDGYLFLGQGNNCICGVFDITDHRLASEDEVCKLFDAVKAKCLKSGDNESKTDKFLDFSFKDMVGKMFGLKLM